MAEKRAEAEGDGEREGEEVGLVHAGRDHGAAGNAGGDHGAPGRVGGDHGAPGRAGGVGGRCVGFAHEDPLLALTLLGVVVGLCLGLLLAAVLPGAADTTGMRETIVKLISFPGKLFLNLLKMMVLPLISGSMIAGVCALQSAGANTGKLAKITLSYFAATTIIAVVIGLVVVNVIQPGACMRACVCARARSRRSRRGQSRPLC
jgi:hypothetical protein